MVDCPCGSGLSIPPGQQTCPACGTDLAPFYRLKTLGEQILEEREHFTEEKRRQEKQISLLKKGLLILPAVTLLIGLYSGPALRGPVKTEQPAPLIQDPVQPPASASASAQAPDGTSNIETVKFFYTIKKGDSLSKISFNFYGNSSLWEKIYEANRDRLKDPNIISEGTEIIIPYDGK